MSGIQQLVDLPSKLRIKVKPMFSTPLTAYPNRAVGVEIADGFRRVWIIFTNETQRPVLLKGYGVLTYAFYFVPASVGEWTEVTVDVEWIYKEMCWDQPPLVWTERGDLVQNQLC